jgi:ATP-dependent protease HslVU (ClpYQ) ATPase subunit
MSDMSFNAHKLQGTKVVVDAEYVREHTASMATNIDVQKYIL